MPLSPFRLDNATRRVFAVFTAVVLSWFNFASICFRPRRYAVPVVVCGVLTKSMICSTRRGHCAARTCARTCRCLFLTATAHSVALSIERWREAVGGQIHFAPYQKVAAQFSNIGAQAFKRAAHFIDADGRTSRGAEAFFAAAAHCGRKQWVLDLYRTFPPFAIAADAVYSAVAANRPALATLRRIWWGKDLRRPTYHIASALFCACWAWCI